MVYISFSTNVHSITIRNNIFSDNRGFQIGYSDLFLKDHPSWQVVAREQNIQITGNLIDGRNIIDSPIESGGYPIDQVKIYAVSGDRATFGDPLFKDPANQDFTLGRRSPAAISRVAAKARLAIKVVVEAGFPAHAVLRPSWSNRIGFAPLVRCGRQ